MGVELMRAYVTVVGDSSHAAADISKTVNQVQSTLGGLSSFIESAFGAVGIGLGLHSLISIFSEGEKAADELQRTMEKLEVRFNILGSNVGVSLEKMKEWGAEISDKTLFGSKNVMGTETILMQFDSLQGELFHRVLKASADVATMGLGSMESSARMLGRAMEDPARGMMMLRRVGITLTQQEQENIKIADMHNDKLRARALLLAAIERKTIDPTTGKHVSETMAETDQGRQDMLDKQLRKIKVEMGKIWDPVAEGMTKFQIEFYKTMTIVAKWISDTTLSWGKWVSENRELVILLGKIVIVVGLMVTVYYALTKAIQMAAAAQAFLVGLTGKGLILVAASAAAATAIYLKMEKSLNASKAGADKTIAGLNKGAAAGGPGGEAGVGKPNMFTPFRVEGMPEGWEPRSEAEWQKDVDKLKLDIEGFKRRITQGDQKPGDAEGLVKAFKRAGELDLEKEYIDKSKITQGAAAEKKLEETRHQLEELRDRATQAQVAYRKFSEQKLVGPNQLAEYKKLVEEIDKVKLERGTFEPLQDQIEALEQNWGEAAKAVRKFRREHPQDEAAIERFRKMQSQLDNLKKNEAIKDMRLDIEALENGWSEAEKAVEKFKRAAGTTPAQLENFKKAKMALEGVTFTKSMETPWEKYLGEIKNIDRMLKAGTITPETATRGKQKAWESMFGGETNMGFAEYGKKVQSMILKQHLGMEVPVQQLKVMDNQLVIQKLTLQAVKDQQRGLQ